MGKSTLSISAILAVVAVGLTSLYIAYAPRPQAGRDKQAPSVIPLSQQQRTIDSNGQPIRVITANPSSGSAQRIAPSSQSGASPGSASSGSLPAVPPPSTETAAPSASADIRSSGEQSEGTSILGLKADTSAGGADDRVTATAGSTDLNTASVEQLNGLGAGMIGKRIVDFRPYTSVDDLLTRRVLKRSDYQAIRAAVTVR